MFGNHCDRLKEFTFETNDDGTPKTARWAYQNLKCDRIGYGYGVGAKGVGSLYELYKWNKNCGITGDDRVVDESSYNQLKDSENWWSNFEEYSRYNHDSAVNTINSLPDCSAYIEEIGDGTNTITFRAEVGSATDGGAVGNLTEEEIAVAAAKGWTVSLW